MDCSPSSWSPFALGSLRSAVPSPTWASSAKSTSGAGNGSMTKRMRISWRCVSSCPVPPAVRWGSLSACCAADGPEASWPGSVTLPSAVVLALFATLLQATTLRPPVGYGAARRCRRRGRPCGVGHGGRLTPDRERQTLALLAAIGADSAGGNDSNPLDWAGGVVGWLFLRTAVAPAEEQAAGVPLSRKTAAAIAGTVFLVARWTSISAAPYTRPVARRGRQLLPGRLPGVRRRPCRSAAPVP